MASYSVKLTSEELRYIALFESITGAVVKDCIIDEEEVTYYGKLSEIPVYTYQGTSWDLGSVCGRPHMVTCLAVEQPGDSKILKLKEE